MDDLRWRFPLSLVCGDVIRPSEYLDGGIAFHAIVFAQVGFLCAVNLDQGNVFLFQRGSGLFVLRSQSLAMAAPGGKEFSEDKVMAFDEIDKRVFLEVVDIGGSYSSGRGDKPKDCISEGAHGGGSQTRSLSEEMKERIEAHTELFIDERMMLLCNQLFSFLYSELSNLSFLKYPLFKLSVTLASPPKQAPRSRPSPPRQ